MQGLSWNQIAMGAEMGARMDEFNAMILDRETEQLMEVMGRMLERMDTDEPSEHGDPGDETD